MPAAPFALSSDGSFFRAAPSSAQPVDAREKTSARNREPTHVQSKANSGRPLNAPLSRLALCLTPLDRGDRLSVQFRIGATIGVEIRSTVSNDEAHFVDSGKNAQRCPGGTIARANHGPQSARCRRLLRAPIPPSDGFFRVTSVIPSPFSLFVFIFSRPSVPLVPRFSLLSRAIVAAPSTRRAA